MHVIQENTKEHHQFVKNGFSFIARRQEEAESQVKPFYPRTRRVHIKYNLPQWSDPISGRYLVFSCMSRDSQSTALPRYASPWYRGNMVGAIKVPDTRDTAATPWWNRGLLGGGAGPTLKQVYRWRGSTSEMEKQIVAARFEKCRWGNSTEWERLQQGAFLINVLFDAGLCCIIHSAKLKEQSVTVTPQFSYLWHTDAPRLFMCVCRPLNPTLIWLAFSAVNPWPGWDVPRHM